MSRSAGPRGSRQKHSCLNCRRRKIKCNFAIPCSACIRSGQSDDCIRYPAMVLGRGLLASKLGGSDTSKSVSSTKATVVPDVRTSENSSSLTDQKSISQLHSALAESASELASMKRLPEQAVRLSELSPFTSLLSDSSRYQFLVSIIPAKKDCDILLNHYIKNQDWVYHCVHWPSFLEVYSFFWSSESTGVGPGWLCLLLVCLATACLDIPKSSLVPLSITPKSSLELSDTFFQAYVQCRQIAESQPSIHLLQAFLASQTYLLHTKKPNLLQSLLASSIRQAQLLEIDKEPNANNGGIEAEMRHRVWWDLLVCDTYQSLRNGVAPLVAANMCNVPLPANCNDDDMTNASITLFPDNIPTMGSCARFRARLMQIMSKVFRAPSDEISSLSFRLSLQQELSNFRKSLPWYFCLTNDGNLPSLMPGFEYIRFQHYVLDASVSIHQFRNLFKFCSISTIARDFCREAVLEGSLVMNALLKDSTLSCDVKMNLTLNQSFSVSVMQCMYLAFEVPTKDEQDILRDNVNRRMEHFRHLEVLMVLPEKTIESKTVIYKMLNIKEPPRSSVPLGPGNQVSQASVASQISGQFGNRPDIEEYINKAAIRYMLNNDNSPENSGVDLANRTEVRSEGYLGPFSRAPAPNSRKADFTQPQTSKYSSSPSSDEVINCNFDLGTWDEALCAYSDYFMDLYLDRSA